MSRHDERRNWNSKGALSSAGKSEMCNGLFCYQSATWNARYKGRVVKIKMYCIPWRRTHVLADIPYTANRRDLAGHPR